MLAWGFLPLPRAVCNLDACCPGIGHARIGGGGEGSAGAEGGLSFLLVLFLFVSSALYLPQCPLSSLRLHTKDWRGLEGLGGSFKPPFRKDLVSLLRKRFHREDLLNLLSALRFWGEYED